MTDDPVRLLSQEDDAFTRSLLHSAKEGDRDAARAHKALVLGAAGGAAAGTAALATAARLSSRGFFASAAGKWIFGGLVLVGGLGAATLLWPRGASQARDALDPAGTAAPAIVASSADAKLDPPIAAPPAEIAPAADPASPAPAKSDPAITDAKPAATTDPSRAAPRGATVADPDRPEKQASDARSSGGSAPSPAASAPGLAEEVAALKAARDALAKNQPARCLDAVNAYFAAFPAGHLSAEARYLRVEAMLQGGRADEARALARSMLASNPKSPYASRLRAIAGDAP